MAVNQNHTGNRRGVIIPYGESVLKHCEDVDLSFLQWPEESHLFKGTKRGMLFLTSYRVIFITSHAASDPMLSFMMPFDLLSNCSIEQPVFSPNYIQGTIHAAPDGGWEGQATFKLSFRKGGAIEFGQLLMKAASAASRGVPLRSLTVLVAPGSMMCTSQAPCRTQFLSMVPHRDMDPNIRDMDPHHQDMDPHHQKLCPHHQDLCPHHQDMDSRHQDLCPHHQNMDPHLKEVKPLLQYTKPCLLEVMPHLWKMNLYLLKVEPGVKKL
ncbi:postacrosomal sheath WW domain-binding protein [Talpa occidentalis]|uniref:postacrosomal sheath WW domain-binding protein n=1 Tax=Talpa occidentalis TaxID=50954 RepID=UPI00188EC2BF|nr:postacrosomal sheath WW domain-binding protein [Talpa occidentalis]